MRSCRSLAVDTASAGLVPALLVTCVLALGSGLAACGGSADDDPPPAAMETPAPLAGPGKPPAPATPAPLSETPPTTPDPPLPEPPAEPVEPHAPAASPPTDEPTTTASEEAPVPVPETTPLLYDTYDLSGTVADPGHYAFLADPDDPSSVVSTYEELRDGTTTGLLVHQHDGYGASQTTLYDAVESGDLVEWRQAPDCFVRYQVTAVQPDPTGTVPRKLLTVAWMTYAFAGCSGGVIDTRRPATLDWADLPDLGGTSLTTPIRHGILQVIPEGWTGPLDPGETHTLPEGAPAYPGPVASTDDVAVARGYPYWREPVLPAGWTFSFAYTGGLEVSYGYCAVYDAADGYLNVEICGEALLGSGTWGMPASWLTDGGSDGMRAGVRETRWISGRPAVVRYSPEGPHHYSGSSGRVWVHDVATQSMYKVIGLDPGLRGSNIADVIAIARSLFESPNSP